MNAIILYLSGYSYIVDPYMCLLFEVMEAITTALMTTSAVAYAAELGTTKTLATIQGVVAGTYYGMGEFLHLSKSISQINIITIHLIQVAEPVVSLEVS